MYKEIGENGSFKGTKYKFKETIPEEARASDLVDKGLKQLS